ncbi:MAG: hypothetical protein PHY59_05750 [Methanobacterium sp.]|nr:hypothetical protein [Methanobacterium sp.]
MLEFVSLGAVLIMFSVFSMYIGCPEAAMTLHRPNLISRLYSMFITAFAPSADVSSFNFPFISIIII